MKKPIGQRVSVSGGEMRARALELVVVVVFPLKTRRNEKEGPHVPTTPPPPARSRGHGGVSVAHPLQKPCAATLAGTLPKEGAARTRGTGSQAERAAAEAPHLKLYPRKRPAQGPAPSPIAESTCLARRRPQLDSRHPRWPPEPARSKP